MQGNFAQHTVPGRPTVRTRYSFDVVVLYQVLYVGFEGVHHHVLLQKFKS